VFSFAVGFVKELTIEAVSAEEGDAHAPRRGRLTARVQKSRAC
jgi:hypothetical protein